MAAPAVARCWCCARRRIVGRRQLMRRRLEAALAGLGEDWSTLLLWWAAPEGAPVGEPGDVAGRVPVLDRAAARADPVRWERVLRGEADRSSTTRTRWRDSRPST